MNYVIAASKVWNPKMVETLTEKVGDCFHWIKTKEDLNLEGLRALNPEAIFFPHWSYKIPMEIYREFKCIGFHMTDLPFGRGGSPLQNLIIRGIRQTKLSAMSVVDEIDAGDIYLKRDLDLSGCAQAIYERASDVIEDMIVDLIREKPEPKPQEGTVVLFERRKPEESNMVKVKEAEDVYDFIRMLDAEGYPHAFLETDHLLLEFRSATLDGKVVEAKVTIKDKVK